MTALPPQDAITDPGSSPSPAMHRGLETNLTDAVLREMLRALGRAPDGVARRLLGPVLRPPAARFARLMAAADARVAQSGMTAAADWLLQQLVQGVHVRGADALPLTGPLLAASNHPGAYDSAVIIASLPPRSDLLMLVSDVPFLRRLPAIGRHLIYVSQDPHERMNAVRATIRHLKAGGAVMTFGTGLVDPDPDLLPGAAEALERWYESLALILRRVPQTRVVTTIVSSVVAPSYMRHPLIRLVRGDWQQRRLAEYLQISAQMLSGRKAPLTPRVTFAAPIAAAELAARPGEPITMGPIIARAKETLAEHMAIDLSGEPNYTLAPGGQDNPLRRGSP